LEQDRIYQSQITEPRQSCPSASANNLSSREFLVQVLQALRTEECQAIAAAICRENKKNKNKKSIPFPVFNFLILFKNKLNIE
jgi:hypothetical protein